MRLLVGRSICAAAYYEIEYEGGFVGWRSTPNVGHLVDHGVDLTMVDGHTCLVTRDQTFNQYDLLVTTNALREAMGPPSLAHGEYAKAIDHLVRISCIELTDGIIWLREWIRVKYGA